MAGPARGGSGVRGGRGASRGASLALTLLFVLVATSVSAGLVMYTAWVHDLANGPYAVLFAVLSAKAALTWFAWNDQEEDGQLPAVDERPKQD